MESGRTVVFGMVVLMSMLALSHATIECYACAGIGTTLPCGHGAKFSASGTGVSILNCTSCAKVVTSGKTIARLCGTATTVTNTCSGSVCTHTCITALCNHSDVPRYALPAIVVALIVSVIAKFSQK